MNKIAENIKLYKFNIELKAQGEARLPGFKGSMLRGAFGWSIRKTLCITKEKNCNNCIIKSNCSYYQLFETETPKTDLWFMKNVKKAPHPFLINVPYRGKTIYTKGNSLNFSVTFFGNYVQLFPFVAYSFQKMGIVGFGAKRYKFELNKIHNIINDSKKKLVYSKVSNKLTNRYEEFDLADYFNKFNMDAEEVTLKFKTPFRVQANNYLIRNTRQLTAEILIRTILRRCYIVSFLYGEKNVTVLDLNALKGIEISENNLRFEEWKRYSNRQKRKIEMSGFLGKITLKGEGISKLMPYITLTSNLNIGKNTIFGLGNFEII